MGRFVAVALQLLALNLIVVGTSGKLLHCEDLPVELCAFSVSSAGSRCVLEKSIFTSGHVEFVCQTSNVGAHEFAEWVETDECVEACGLERLSVGISTDAFAQRGFTKDLCSHRCRYNCPNVIHLFVNLAAGEGVPLKQVCKLQEKEARRNMGETLSFASLSANTVNAWDQLTVEGPTSSLFTDSTILTAPTPAPFPFTDSTILTAPTPATFPFA